MKRGEPPHTLAGAYAVNALAGREKRLFERHLARCRECASEIRSLREAVAALASTAAVHPASGLKQRVMAETARTRQRRAAAGWRAPSWWRRPGGRFAHSPLIPRLALAMAGVFMVITATVWATGQFGAHRAAGDQTQVAAVLTAPDATMLTARVTTGGHATIVMSHGERMLVFAASGLRRLAPSQRYELWLIGQRGNDRPAGLLPVPAHGMTGPAIASGIEPGDRLGLTVEPAGGSARPTSAMIIDLAL